jgi:heme exporter protein D
MTHLPFIIASYGLAVLVGAAYSIDAWMRMSRARRRLAAIDPRANRP